MQRCRPTINNISFYDHDHNWRTRTFLPIFDSILIWAEDAKCDGCKLDTSCHPLVQDEEDKHCYHKLCTVTAIKAKLISAKEIEGR